MKPPPLPGLNLSKEELEEASGGYIYPARQLRELHARGYVLATIGKNGRVVLPRVHYLAVNKGQYGAKAQGLEPLAPATRPNLEGLMKHLAARQKKK